MSYCSTRFAAQYLSAWHKNILQKKWYYALFAKIGLQHFIYYSRLYFLKIMLHLQVVFIETAKIYI